MEGKFVPEWIYYMSDLLDARNSMAKLHSDCLQNRVTETVVDGVTQVEAPSTAAPAPAPTSASTATPCVA